MFKVTDLQFDIETLGLAPGCVVLSVAALRFDRNEEPDEALQLERSLDPAFCIKRTLSLTRQLALGLQADVGTLDWYFKAEGMLTEIQESGACTEKLETSITALNDFFIESKKMGVGNDTGLWANSPNFDIEIIRVLYKKLDIGFPFPFHHWFDVRTIKDSHNFLYGNARKPDKTRKHDPVYDCVYQTLVIQDFWSTGRSNATTVKSLQDAVAVAKTTVGTSTSVVIP